MSGFLDLRAGAGAMTLESVVLGLLATFLLSQVIAWVYLRTHRGVTYSASFARSLVVLSLIVALVMMVIGSSIARAFGLFGALALIRFRTPVKDANDTVFLFLAVAIGIAVGTGGLLAGAAGTVLIGGAILYLRGIRFGDPLTHDGLLRLQLPTDRPDDRDVRRVLGDYCESFDLLHVREVVEAGAMELSFQLKLFDLEQSSQLVAAVEQLPPARGVSLLIQDREVTP